MSLFLPSYLNSWYLHLRRWQQKPHLWGLRWTGRSPSLVLQGGGAIDSHSPKAGGCGSGRISISWLSYPTTESCPDMKTTQQDVKSEPVPEWSSWRGSESSTLEIDVYSVACEKWM